MVGGSSASRTPNKVEAPNFRDGLRWVNERYRRPLGLPDLKVNSLLEAAAAKHAQYIRINAALYGAGGPLDLTRDILNAHKEVPGHPGYRGETPTDRCRSAGFSSSCGEDIFLWDGDSVSALQTWLNTPFHGVPILQAAEIGYGARALRIDSVGTGNVQVLNPDHDVLSVNLSDDSTINKAMSSVHVWPFDGASDVPHFAAREVPDPLAAYRAAHHLAPTQTVGPPLFFLFSGAKLKVRLRDESGRTMPLLRPSTPRAIRGTVTLSPQVSPSAKSQWQVLFSEQQLKIGETYRIEIENAAGAKFSVRFSTQPRVVDTVKVGLTGARGGRATVEDVARGKVAVSVEGEYRYPLEGIEPLLAYSVKIKRTGRLAACPPKRYCDLPAETAWGDPSLRLRDVWWSDTKKRRNFYLPPGRYRIEVSDVQTRGVDPKLVERSDRVYRFNLIIGARSSSVSAPVAGAKPALAIGMNGTTATWLRQGPDRGGVTVSRLPLSTARDAVVGLLGRPFKISLDSRPPARIDIVLPIPDSKVPASTLSLAVLMRDGSWQELATTVDKVNGTLRATLVTGTRDLAAHSASTLAVFDFIVGVVSETGQFFSELIGDRADRPSCNDGNLPTWAESVTTFLNAESRLFSCGQTDPGDSSVVEVRLVNNRTYPVIVSLDNPYAWAYQVTGEISWDELKSMLASHVGRLSLPKNEILIPPTSELRIGLRDPGNDITIVSKPARTYLAVGMAMLILKQLGVPERSRMRWAPFFSCSTLGNFSSHRDAVSRALSCAQAVVDNVAARKLAYLDTKFDFVAAKTRLLALLLKAVSIASILDVASDLTEVAQSLGSSVVVKRVSPSARSSSPSQQITGLKGLQLRLSWVDRGMPPENTSVCPSASTQVTVGSNGALGQGIGLAPFTDARLVSGSSAYVFNASGVHPSASNQGDRVHYVQVIYERGAVADIDGSLVLLAPNREIVVIDFITDGSDLLKCAKPISPQNSPIGSAYPFKFDATIARRGYGDGGSGCGYIRLDRTSASDGTTTTVTLILTDAIWNIPVHRIRCAAGAVAR
jgi:hypothetical protein